MTTIDLDSVQALRKAHDSETWDSGHRASKHEQVPFLAFDVDKKMLGIIENLWALGMPTNTSCEGHPELCHRDVFFNEDYYARILFMQVADAAHFFSWISEELGVGETYTDEPFQLKTVLPADIRSNEWEEENYSYTEIVNLATRGEVRFHPGYIAQIEELLKTRAAEQDQAEALSIAKEKEDLDDAYEALGFDSKIRLSSEQDQNCLIEDPNRD